MAKVLLFSFLLIIGLVASQFLNGAGAHAISTATMVALSFIMIHVGLEFEIDKSRPMSYAWDYIVAASAASFPWIFCALYFIFVMSPSSLWSHADLWKESLLEGLFASPTSAGVLFAMLAAAGLGATWLFKKARILAIFDDLNTILLMIPLKMLMVGVRWQLGVIVLVMAALLFAAWKYLNKLRLPSSWPFVLVYACLIVGVSEVIYFFSSLIDSTLPIHIEVLLPAFVLGCLIVPDEHLHHNESEKKASTLISAIFMVLIGLSMPAINTKPSAVVVDGVDPVSVPSQPTPALAYEGADKAELGRKKQFPGWGMIGVHVVAITILSNLGKMVPAFCYRKDATWRERLALAIGMFPRGEVGAGVLVIALSYGLAGPTLTVAVLSLALNLLATGVFIWIVQKLLGASTPSPQTE